MEAGTFAQSFSIGVLRNNLAGQFKHLFNPVLQSLFILSLTLNGRSRVQFRLVQRGLVIFCLGSVF